MKRTVFTTLLCLGAALAGGCARETYEYRPAQPASAEVAGRPAVSYQLPGGSGTLRIATLGLAKVRKRSGGPAVTAMHVRMDLANRSTAPMTVDMREQVAQMGRYGISYPALYTAFSPVVQVPAGQARAIDLFYPIPEPIVGTQLVPRFDVNWTVHTNAGRATAHADFDRHVM